LLRPFLDGVPLGLAAKALPFRAKLSPGLGIHLFLHAKAEEKSGDSNSKGGGKVSKAGLLGLIDSLESTIRGLSWQPRARSGPITIRKRIIRIPRWGRRKGSSLRCSARFLRHQN